MVSGIGRYMLPGQPPAWQKSLGHGPLGQLSHAWLDALLRPTAKPESSLCMSELSHFSQLCFREVPAFSRNFVTCPQSPHLYSNIGTAQSPFYRSTHFDAARDRSARTGPFPAEIGESIVKDGEEIGNIPSERRDRQTDRAYAATKARAIEARNLCPNRGGGEIA